MRRLILTGFVFSSLFVTAQNRTNQWILSYQWLVNDSGIDFNTGTADTFSVWKDLEFFATDASICDTTGQLLFYTNGVYIANRNNDSLFNCQDFNPGYATEYYGYNGLGISQGAIILPEPEASPLYCLVYVTGELVDSGSQLQPLRLAYSEVDMELDNGLGGIVNGKKNISLVEDTLVWGRLTACKHANGRDWWVISHRWNSDLYYKFLLTPDSILGPFQQHAGSLVVKDDIWGQACFSPQGDKFCYINRNYNFDYMQFDRCSGKFYDAINILLPDSNISQGCSFSPNGRFIYINTLTQLFQYDTWASNVGLSKILIDTVPLYQPGIPDWFAVQMLAPDNKIYISTYNGVKALHAINHPDSLGISCGFLRKGLTLPTYNGYSIPNHPNYDLGPLTGSECDTLYLSNTLLGNPDFSFSIRPNPSNGIINIVYDTNEDCFFHLYDMHGKQVASISLFHYFKNRLIYVNDLPTGLYLATVTLNGEKVWSEKVVVQRQ